MAEMGMPMDEKGRAMVPGGNFAQGPNMPQAKPGNQFQQQNLNQLAREMQERDGKNTKLSFDEMLETIKTFMLKINSMDWKVFP